MPATSQSNQNQERQSYRLRWLGADLPPSVLEGGAREAGGPGPPRVIPRRYVVKQPQLHPVGSFAERRPANSPHGDFSQTFPQTFPQPTETSNNSILSGERGCFTDKRELRLPDTRCLNFPDASYLTKRPKSGITNSAQKTSAAEKWSNLQTSWRLVVK